MSLRSLSALIVAGLAALSPALAQQAAPELFSALANGNHARVIVALRPQVTSLGQGGGGLADARQRVGENQDRVLGSLDRDDYRLITRWQTVNAFQAEVTYSGLIHLLAHPTVLRVDLDVSGEIQMTQSAPLIGADQVAALGYDGTGSTVAVVDTGVSASHPDLAGKIIGEACFCVWDGAGCCPNGLATQSGTGAAADDHGHGSHVAGIVAGAGIQAPAGIAPGAKIIAVKAIDSQGRFWETAQIVSALEWIAVHHPEVTAVNLSLGTYASFDDYCDGATAWTMALAEAINNLTNLGVAVFAASGNAGSYTNISAPACVHNAISVGAVYDSAFGSYNSEETAADKVASFSNSNQTLDLLAPGCSITSVGLGTPTATRCGTSMAAPHAAGAAALLRSLNPGLDVEETRQLLSGTGLSIVDGRNGLSVPRIDLVEALGNLEIALSPRSPSRGELFTSCSPAPVFEWEGGDFNSYTLTFSLNSDFLPPNTVFPKIKTPTWTPPATYWPRKVFLAGAGLDEPVNVYWRVTGVQGKNKTDGPWSFGSIAPQDDPLWVSPAAGTLVQAGADAPLPAFSFQLGTCNESAQIQFFTNNSAVRPLTLPSRAVKAETWTPAKADQKKFAAWARKLVNQGAPLLGRLVVRDNVGRVKVGEAVALQLVP